MRMLGCGLLGWVGRVGLVLLGGGTLSLLRLGSRFRGNDGVCVLGGVTLCLLHLGSRFRGNDGVCLLGDG